MLRPCQKTAAVSLAMADKLSVESRLRAILDVGMNRRALSRRTTACVTIAVMVFCVGLPGIQAQDEGKTSQSPIDDDPIVSAAPTTDDEFAWNRTDKYVPPNFADYFPEKDEVAVKRLDEFMSSSRLRTDNPDDYIEIVRRGLRSTKLHKTSVLRMLGNTFIWGKQPQNEKAIELMYHASGADDNGVVHYAMYFGPTVVVDRSDNLMRMMMLNHHRFGHEIQRRLNWSFKTYGDQAKTADQLANLLDDADQLGEFATIATYDYYKNLTGNSPPQPERFATLGKWAIGFSHHEVTANQRDGVQQLRDMLGQFLDVPDDQVIEYVGRIDGVKWVGVALVRGIAKRDAIAARIEASEEFSLEFADRLDERLFQNRRLREFARHFDGDLVNARPEYTLPELDRNFAWNRQDKFEAPSFEKFFPDDAAAGRRLDDIIAAQDELKLHDREILSAIRQGLKRSKASANRKLAFLSSVLGWPADPYATEIMFQASALDAPKDIQYYAVYYGLGNWGDKSDNVLRQFAELFAQPVMQGNHSAQNMHRRILWSVRNNEDEKSGFAKHIVTKLENHEELDDSTLARLIQTYQELTEKSPPNLRDFEDRGFFFLVWHRSDERDESSEAMSNYQATLARLPRFPEEKIAWHARDQKGKALGIGLIRGFDSYNWLLDELQSDDLNSIVFGGVWPQPWDLKNGFPNPQELDKFFRSGK